MSDPQLIRFKSITFFEPEIFQLGNSVAELEECSVFFFPSICEFDDVDIHLDFLTFCGVIPPRPVFLVQFLYFAVCLEYLK